MIRLTHLKRKTPIYINPDHIAWFIRSEEQKSTEIGLSNGDSIYVEESFGVVSDLIEEAKKC